MMYSIPTPSHLNRSRMLMRFASLTLIALWSAFLIAGTVQCQWVISAIHPDPTPPMGAPTAEFIALVARGPADSCISSDNWSLLWNGNVRELPSGCWEAGTVLVAHKASDSLSFQFGTAEPAPFASWPALLNGGGTIILLSPVGEVHDAMVYTEESLGDGGRPLLRSHILDCGAASNQHLWTEGRSPFSDFHSAGESAVEPASEWARKATESRRVVPRGGGACDWYLGSTFDPVSMLKSRAWVGGQPAEILWKSDSVVSLVWDDRILESEGLGDTIPITFGPLRACHAGAQQRVLSSGFVQFAQHGEVEVTGVLCDPVTGGPHPTQQESFEITNVGANEVDLSSWDFDGARLVRQCVLEPGARVTLGQKDFEDWPGMPNGGGSLSFVSPMGEPLAETSWSPCDHDSPSLVGKGLALTRNPLPGSDWHTAGNGEFWAQRKDAQLKGFGCQTDFNGMPIAIDLYFNRYTEHLPEWSWSLEENESVEIHSERVQGLERAWRISWDGMGEEVLWPGIVELSVQGPGAGNGVFKLQCPAIPPAAESPCLRVVEAMWDAADSGSEFMELQNCGSQPLDLMGLQATVVEHPFPSDWRSWVSPNESLVLMPGAVAAFGRCPKWMGNGLPGRGPSRWEAEEWSALNDSEGMLAIRLPFQGAHPLDSVGWDSDFEGPWWWSSEGWSWMREGSSGTHWTPSMDRGSPGRVQDFQWMEDCRDAVSFSPSDGGLFPRLFWQLPESGGTIEVRSVAWPSGRLMERLVLEDLDMEGNAGLPASGASSRAGQVIWEVRWWSPSCKGRKVLRLPPGSHG